jgi:hypothetical protein
MRENFHQLIFGRVAWGRKSNKIALERDIILNFFLSDSLGVCGNVKN